MLSPREIMNIVSLMLQMDQSQHAAVYSLIQEIYESGAKEDQKVVFEEQDVTREIKIARELHHERALGNE